MDDEYNDLWELDRPVLVTIVTELRAEIEQAKREINARKGTQEATDQALIDEIRKHNRDRRTIRALVVAFRITMNAIRDYPVYVIRRRVRLAMQDHRKSARPAGKE